MSDFNLGTVTAYGYAKDKGYTGTEDEFAALMASYADVAEQAAESAEQAAASATTATTKASEASDSASAASASKTAAQNAQSSAESAATTATTKASEASNSASTAMTKAGEATTAAGTATTAATSAAGSATTATTKAGEAATSATTAAEAAQRAEDAAATLVIDDTLTHAGQAADAKKTGDEIGDLKDGFSEISSATKNLNTKGCGRYSANNSTGVISKKESSTTIVGMSDKIACDPSTVYTVTFYDVTMTGATIYAHYYDYNGSFINFGYRDNASNSWTFTTPSNAYYVFCSAYKNPITLGTDPKIQVEKGSVSTEYIQPISANDLVSREQIAQITNGLVSPISISLNDGYYTANGTITPASSPNYEKYTQKINATLYTGIEYQLNYSSSKAVWFTCGIWKTDGTFTRTVIINENGSSFSGTVAIGSDVIQIAFSFRSFGEENVLSLIGVTNMQAFVNVASKSNTIDNNQTQASIAINVNRFKPFYDHIFIDKINGNNVVIPSESLFNIQISRRLGFDMIEANVQATSDNNFIVMHGVSGKFGQQVEHIDGVTNIADTAINSVTLEWIKTNVRYKSLYEKYRVAPPSLEEFLYECRINCMIPLVTANNDDAVEIINNIMGKDNYVAYNGSRNKTAAPIMTFPSLTTKEDILALCDSYGKPYMYCMANPTAFTDTELVEIVDLLHTNGYLIGFAGSYQTEAESQRLLSLGFDFSASGYQINDIDSGNICNLSADIDYSDFTTDGTIANNLLTLASGDTITLAETIPSVFLGGASLHIRFNGTLTIRMGNYINDSFTSDGSKSMWFSTYYLNSAPTFIITATAQTQIINIDFKASKM